MSPYSGTAISGCDCPGSTPVSGVLIDGVIPSIDTTQRGTWASELFTVSRSGRESINIGFQFNSVTSYIRGIEIVLFNCPVQGIGITDINVYSSYIFPGFTPGAFVQHDVEIATPSDSCESLSTIFIPVQLSLESFSFFFIEFLFTGGSSVHQLNWLYLGEIRFNNKTPANVMPTDHEVPQTTTGNEGSSTISQPSITTLNNYETLTTPSITQESMINSNWSETTTQKTLTMNPTNVSTVTALASIVGLLIVLMIGAGALFLCYVSYKKHKMRLLEDSQNQYTLATELTWHEKRSSLPTTANSCYSKRSSRRALDLPDPPPSVYYNQEMYKEVRTDENSGLYDDTVENHYALIPESSSEVRFNDMGNSMEVNKVATDREKRSTHAVINKSEQPLDEIQNQAISVNPRYEIPTTGLGDSIITLPQSQVGIYSQVEEGVTEEMEEFECEYYDDAKESRAASQLSACCRQVWSPGLLPELSRPLYHTLKDNPANSSEWSFQEDSIENEGPQEEAIYANPDPNYQGESQQTVYETVYSDSQVKPSLFKRKSVVLPNNCSTVERKDNSKEIKEEEIEEESSPMCSPIYLPHCCEATSLIPKTQSITVNSENIRGVKVLGTGFFGKVILADTVGLSLKDLGMSDYDDNKNVSIKVAVKKLKLNASKSTKEAFEREGRFMSRLNHPNVVRMLGVCTTDQSQFIMMEYMEKGDLNGYLEEYQSITHHEGTPVEGEICVSTLVQMCIQISDAMKYLTSHNFIHRDLAARNCLVSNKGVIKLADFGMSRNLYESHYYMIQGKAVLPVRWMATECFYGKFSAKTDVWAFGVTMWEIFTLAKERPYSDMEDLEVVDDAIEKEQRTLLQQPQHCPDDVFEVMMRCWASDPKDRATFEELHAMLMQLN